MKSSFYFLIIMNGLSCFIWQSHAAQMIRVTELQAGIAIPKLSLKSRKNSSLHSNKSPKLKLYDSTDFPLVIIISNLSPTHPTSCFEKSHHSVIFLVQ